MKPDKIKLPLSKKIISVGRDGHFAWELQKKLTEAQLKKANEEAKQLLEDLTHEWFEGTTYDDNGTPYLTIKIILYSEGIFRGWIAYNFTRTMNQDMCPDIVMFETL